MHDVTILFISVLSPEKSLIQGTEVDEYETSVKMSTYLLSFIICEFKSLYQQTGKYTNKLKLFNILLICLFIFAKKKLFIQLKTLYKVMAFRKI